MASQQNDTDQVSAAELQRRHWRAFTRDHDEADAARSFTARYGCPPAHIIEAGGNLLLGPIPTGRADAYTTMPDVKP